VQPELAVSEHDDTRFSLFWELIQHVRGRSQRLGEHRLLVGHAVRDRDQATFRHDQSLCQCAVSTRDAEHSAPGAMMAVPFGAVRASLTAGVDVCDHPAPAPARCIAFEDLPDEFVPEHTVEAEVATHQLQVRVADTGQAHRDERLTLCSLRLGVVAEQLRSVAEYQGEHAPGSVSRGWRDVERAVAHPELASGAAMRIARGLAATRCAFTVLGQQSFVARIGGWCILAVHEPLLGRSMAAAAALGCSAERLRGQIRAAGSRSAAGGC
jgi:hypothetical protein